MEADGDPTETIQGVAYDSMRPAGITKCLQGWLVQELTDENRRSVVNLSSLEHKINSQRSEEFVTGSFSLVQGAFEGTFRRQ